VEYPGRDFPSRTNIFFRTEAGTK